MKILISGDSFAADWSIKHTACAGWPNMMSSEYQVINIAQAGCSEYKIHLQLKSVDLTAFDAIIVSHTSPYRWYVKKHPVHTNDSLHYASDLIYSDIAAHSLDNPSLIPIVNFFENYFDIDYAKYVHNLICADIENLLSACSNVIHIQNFDSAGMYQFSNTMDFYPVFQAHPGLINHYSEHGNKIIFQQLKSWLENANISPY